MELSQTILHQWHVEAGAKMTDFAGYHMPLSYPQGARFEHKTVRESCGLFDVSHMGRLLISCRSDGALDEFEKLVSCQVAALGLRSGSYGLVCNAQGTVLDDIFLFRLDENNYLMVVNASNRAKISQWCAEHLKTADFRDVSSDIGMIALQGPKAMELLTAAGYKQIIAQLNRRNTVSDGDPENDGIFTRTGYSGEDGVELYAPNMRILQIWKELLNASNKYSINCTAAGLAARDSLRFEAGFALYGHELSEEISPIQAKLSWACKLGNEQPDFIGKTAILIDKERGTKKPILRTAKLIEKGVPRQDMRVYDEGGTDIGWVCSGMVSPTLDGFYANIFADPAKSKLGSQIFIDIRGTRKKAQIINRPLYKST